MAVRNLLKGFASGAEDFTSAGLRAAVLNIDDAFGAALQALWALSRSKGEDTGFAELVDAHVAFGQ